MTKDQLRKELHSIGVKTYKNKKTNASMIKREQVIKALDLLTEKVLAAGGEIYTFDEAKSIVDKARGGKKKLGNNTYLEKTDDGYGIRLHQTYVVEILPDDQYRLDSGGWETVTTKDRINDYSPASISQKKGNWYLNDGTKYRDGIVVDSKGKEVAA